MWSNLHMIIVLFLFYQSYLDLVMRHRWPSLMALALMAAYLRVAVVMLYDIVIYLHMVNKFVFFLLLLEPTQCYVITPYGETAT